VLYVLNAIDREKGHVFNYGPFYTLDEARAYGRYFDKSKYRLQYNRLRTPEPKE
jgi:hypothetical protein